MAVTLKFIYHTEPSSQKIGPYIRTVNYGQEYVLTSEDKPILNNYNGKQFSCWRIVNEEWNFDTINLKSIQVLDNNTTYEFHFYAVWVDTKIPLQFLAGENIKRVNQIIPGAVYFDSKTKELWFDDPTETESKHLKIIDTDTCLYDITGEIEW